MKVTFCEGNKLCVQADERMSCSGVFRSQIEALGLVLSGVVTLTNHIDFESMGHIPR